MTDPRPLDQIRGDIDRIDRDLVRLLSERASLAIEVGHTKRKEGSPFFVPEREQAIFDRLARENPGPLTHKQLRAIYREIISAAIAAEKPLAVAYWGPVGTFSNQAALQTFGASADLMPVESIAEVFHAVEHGRADYGVVPIESLSQGIVPETLDMFPQTNVRICAELYVPIHMHLVSTALTLGEIGRVYAFGQPANQCKGWLRANLPHAEIVEAAPTARAARLALEDPQGSAICSRLAAETVGIPILVEHIEDNPNNRTRFVVLGYNEPAKTGRDKTSYYVQRPQPPRNAWSRRLKAFEERGGEPHDDRVAPGQARDLRVRLLLRLRRTPAWTENGAGGASSP